MLIVIVGLLCLFVSTGCGSIHDKLPLLRVNEKCLKLGKRKMYIPAYYCFAYYRAQLKHADSSVNKSVKQLKRKYLKNEALALARAGLKHKTAALFNLAISRFTELMGALPSTSAFKKERDIITSQVAKLRRFHEESKSFTSNSNASGETNKIEDDTHPLDKQHLRSKNHIPKKHSLTSKYVKRVDYTKLLSKICESDRFGKCINEHGVIARYLEGQKEPVIIENGPVRQWNLFKKMSWKYLEMNLPEVLEGIRFTKSRFNLYRTYTPQQELKEVAAEDFLELLSDIDSDTISDLDLSFPYFTAQVPKDIVFKHRMQLDLLNASVCRIIAGGDRHCGGHPSRSMQDEHRNANVHIWIGAKNVTARFHYDHAENTFVQFLGRKHFFFGTA